MYQSLSFVSKNFSSLHPSMRPLHTFEQDFQLYNSNSIAMHTILGHQIKFEYYILINWKKVLRVLRSLRGILRPTWYLMNIIVMKKSWVVNRFDVELITISKYFLSDFYVRHITFLLCCFCRLVKSTTYFMNFCICLCTYIMFLFLFCI